MDNDKQFAEKIADLRQEVQQFVDLAEENLIEATAKRLEGLNYTPPIVIPVATFLRLTRDSLLLEIEKLIALPDAEACALAPDNPGKCQDLRIQFVTVLIYYYKKLLQLREGVIEEWEEVDEQYVHD